ncbi:hypothetical protein Tco_0693900 [Tanacetum coccineum]
MSIKYPNYVNLTSSSEEQPNERTPSPPPRKKSLSPPQAPSKSISSKSILYTSSSSPKSRYVHEGRTIDPSFYNDLSDDLVAKFTAIGFDFLLSLDEQICSRFLNALVSCMLIESMVISSDEGHIAWDLIIFVVDL